MTGMDNNIINGRIKPKIRLMTHQALFLGVILRDSFSGGIIRSPGSDYCLTEDRQGSWGKRAFSQAL